MSKATVDGEATRELNMKPCMRLKKERYALHPGL